MEAFTSQLVVAVWILALCSEARVLSKPCTRGELVAVVNSSRLFGFPVECRNACEVLAVSRDSVAACNKGMSEETGWKRCETSIRDALLLQDSKKEHLCILATLNKHIHGGSSCTGEFINECHSLKENSLRPRRSAEMVDNETHSRGQNVHTWAIVISSVVTLMLLVLVSVLCVGSNKNKTEPTSSKASANSAIQNATAVNQPSNHHDSTNQANHNEGENVNGRAKMGDQGQHLYVNVQLEARSKSDREAGSQSPDKNQDQQQPVNLDQEQPVANQDEQLVDQNVDLQAAEPVQDQPQQAVNQPQAPQAAANGDVVDQQRQDAEKTKIPYGVVTIHSDQSNTPADNNYAEVRSEEGEGTQDTMYDCVNYDVINDSSSSKVNENGYSTVVRDQPTQPEQPRRDRMYESVDEAFNKKTIPSAPVFNGDDDEGLEQDDMYEKVPDSFRQKVASFSQAEAPRLPPMNLRSRKPSDDITTVQQQQRSSSAATLPSGGLPSSPLTQHRGRLQSSPSVKAPSYPAPSVPPPAFRAPNPPPDTEDIEDDENALYARPEPTSNRSMSTSLVREKVNLEEARKKASSLPVKAMLSHGGPRSPVILGPLPALPESTKVSSSNQPKEDEEETEDPGYDTTQSVMVNPDYDHLEPDEMQDRGHEVEQQRPEQQQQQEEPLKSPKSPSTVKHDGKGYALPSTKKAEENYAIINLTQKRMSQRKKKQTTGDGGSAAVTSESPIPPSLPPPLDPDLVDEDMRMEPSVPPRLPQSEELVEPNKVEPPYAKVNKGKIADSEQPSGTEEYGDDDEIDPYAAVDIQVLGGVPEVQLTTEREYDSIDNVMPPQPQQPSVNVILSDVEGEYACVRSDATISPIPTHPMPDPATGSVAAHDTSADDTTATTRELAPDDEHSTNSSAEHTEL